MTLLLDLPPQTEARLRAEAERNGMDAPSYALRLLDLGLHRRPADEWEAELRAFVNGLPRPVRPIPDEATRREAFYEESGR